jgi:DNA mismatch endonuclease, patch repair protein
MDISASVLADERREQAEMTTGTGRAAEPGPASSRMRRQRTRDTIPEINLRSELHRRGLRYYVHRKPLPELRREADILFPRHRLAIFVDGCFWHGCPIHGSKPKRNESFWYDKITRNQVRDQETDARLSDHGWLSVRIWEHELAAVAADRIEQLVRSRTTPLRRVTPRQKHP